ncbi:hypothetical protein F5Y18DRAFT_430288 [Xylariaceae sp. FL1019]|nr:hypothetical protein F5Y18DRAFT_430288 [Xylariaceae sp. FL1019]
MPQGLESFHLFALFPYDIRHLVWQQAVFQPGIHFLKFVDTATSIVARFHNLSFADARSTEKTQDAHKPIFSATLQPLFANERADSSHCVVVRKVLAKFRTVCQESKSIVDKLEARLGNLFLDDGRLVLLEKSLDIVCIDYPNLGDFPHHSSTAEVDHLGRWTNHLDLDQLAKIRHLAVRYHHEWDNNQLCAICGRVHSSQFTQHPYPRHVYEFAALFENLETFYFVDPLILRRPTTQDDCPQSRSATVSFASGGERRKHFEVTPASCVSHTCVFDTLSWIHENYVSYCLRTKRGAAHPESVGFKVLGCDWMPDWRTLPAKRPRRASTSNRVKGPRVAGTSGRRIMTPKPPVSSRGDASTSDNIFPVVLGNKPVSTVDFAPELSSEARMISNAIATRNSLLG